MRQLEVMLTEQVARLLAGDEWRPLRWEVFIVQQRLGAYAPLTPAEAEELRRAEGFPRALVLWLAGYDRRADTVARHQFALPSLAEVPLIDGGPLVDEEALRAALTAQGVADRLLSWAIDQIPGLSRVDGHAVLWPGNIVDRSCAVLAVRNTPMSAEELADSIGGGISVRGLRSRLYDDPRVCRVTRTTVGLRSWGGPEYTSIVELMCADLEERGERSLAELASDLASRFDAKTGSVHAYAGAPVFVVEDGLIRLRRQDEPFVPRATPHRIAGLYRAAPDALVFNIEADNDLLRGSGRSIPQEIATFLGVQPGMRMTLHHPVRDIPVSWLETNHMGPNLGSLKGPAEAAGVREGDVVQVWFDRRAHAIEVRRREPPPPGDAMAERLSWLTGLPPYRCQDRPTVADAVQTTPDQVVAVLRRRGDPAVADLVERLPD